MQKIILVISFLVICTSSFAQQSKIRIPSQKEIHLKKAKKHSGIGWFLIGAGGALVLGSAIVSIAHGPSGKDIPDTTIPASLGGGAIVGGTILLVSSVYHGKKALKATAYLNFQPIPALLYSTTNPQYYPAITFKVDAL